MRDDTPRTSDDVPGDDPTAPEAGAWPGRHLRRSPLTADVSDSEPNGEPDGGTRPEENPTAAHSGSTSAEQPRKKRSMLRKVVYVLLALLLILALAMGGLLLYLKHIVDSDVSREDLLPTDSVSRDDAAGNAQNILLLGEDSRNTSLRDGSRSDVIQLVHVSNDRTKLSVVHFPRDLYVDMPGHGKNKINAAYAYGGPKMLAETVEKLTNVHIDHVAQIGFSGFEKLTDDMGGVDIYVSQAIDEKGYGTWKKGVKHMNGEQARHYVQERHQLKNGDIDRGKNQQAWMLAIFQKAKSRSMLSNPMTLTNITRDIADNLAVDKDCTTSYMTSLAYGLRGLKQQKITFYTAPYSGFGWAQRQSVDWVDEPAMKVLGEGLRKDDMSAVPGGRVGSAS